MKEVSAWILSIVGVMVLGVLADMVLSDGKTKKSIQGIFALVALLVIIMPLPDLVKGRGYSPIQFGAGEQTSIDSMYMDTIQAQQLALMEQQLCRELEAQGIEDVRISFFTDSTKTNIISIYADLSKARMPPDKSSQRHKIVKDIIANYMRVDSNMVVVYG